MTPQQLQDWSAQSLDLVERALEDWVPLEAPAGLGEAMRYGVLDGGKRVRALLVLAAAQAVGATRTSEGRDAMLRAAAAVEIIHAYSLVHDDMPCMDNDVLRRGKPTVHVRFGEAQAMLAGDALQALAFEVLTPDEEPGAGVMPAALQARLCRMLARAAGQSGMAGGQAIDLASVGAQLDEVTLRDMHRRKTGALLCASVQMGAVCGGDLPAQSPVWQALSRYGELMGLAFQIVDDVLDATQGSDTLGKTAGKDADANKPTYVSLLGLEGARHEAAELLAQAHAALADSGIDAVMRAPLAALADRIVHREH
ncbi:MAG TPA: polyprenyl synthetase family protein [Aquabacterium sp.]|nr:polyprenyl synthetase family protein [Aquabacterium sp.]